MLIRRIALEQYGPFERLEIPLWSPERPDRRISVLIGENGAGKSLLMGALATSLSWLVARIRGEKNPGSPLSDLAIKNDASAAIVELEAEALGNTYGWTLVKVRKGQRVKAESQLKSATMLANAYAQALTQDEKASLPLIAYYPVERYVLDFPKKIRTKHEFRQINGYEEALTKGIDFRRFFEWFRDREDVRNEGKIELEEIIGYIDMDRLFQFLQKEGMPRDLNPFLNVKGLKAANPHLYRRVINRDALLNDPQYFAVVRALEVFLPEYAYLRIERRPRMRMLIDKSGETYDVLQLSQGEKSLLALVGDIARRLAIMNPGLEDPLRGEGVVLIDEVDLHLHPRWQRTVIRHLRKAFPCCQFILTTHSPLVISDPDNIQVVTLKDGAIRESFNLYGMDVEQVLLQEMDTSLRHEPLQSKLDALLESIQDGKLQKARQLRKQLGNELPPDHKELVRADILLRRQETLHARHQ